MLVAAAAYTSGFSITACSDGHMQNRFISQPWEHSVSPPLQQGKKGLVCKDQISAIGLKY